MLDSELTQSIKERKIISFERDSDTVFTAKMSLFHDSISLKDVENTTKAELPLDSTVTTKVIFEEEKDPEVHCKLEYDDEYLSAHPLKQGIKKDEAQRIIESNFFYRLIQAVINYFSPSFLIDRLSPATLPLEALVFREKDSKKGNEAASKASTKP